MPRTIRFHLNEHCSHAIGDGLRRFGFGVTTATDAGLLRAPDEAIRIILTPLRPDRPRSLRG